MSVSESGVRPILAEAVDLARRALLELQPTGVGEHLGVTGENECAATHHFAATLPGYRGWQWEVVVAAAPDAEYATVSESALLPGPDALVAPDFVPWDQRIRPGDLAPGDLLAPRVDDPRLVPGYLETGDPVVDEVCEEIGLGRRQVLSREGRVEAAERWYSEFGPDTEMARSAPGTCGVCGFFVPLAGALRAAFGVCANAMGADGRVVHVEYGCGAHSDTEMPTGAGSPLYEAYDDAAIEVVPAEELTARDGSAEAEQSSAAARSDAQDSAGDAADSAAVIAIDAGEPSSADPETEKGGPAGTDTPAASTAAGGGAAETETPSSPAGDAHGVGDTGTAADAPTDTGAAAPEHPGTDPAPKDVAAEGVRSGVESPSTTVDDVSATADPAALDADRAPATHTVGEPAETAPAAGAAAVREPADSAAASPETASDFSSAVEAQESGTAATVADAEGKTGSGGTVSASNTETGARAVQADEVAAATAASGEPDADHARASDTVPAGGTAEVAPAADDAPAEVTALSTAADTPNTAADAVTGETAPAAESGAAGAEPVRYSDAWAVSAVRVQPGEAGAAEEN